MTHFMNVCELHGSILGQCRCPDKNKQKKLVHCPGIIECGKAVQSVLPEVLDELHRRGPDQVI